jgi:hypothetical protein
MKEYKILSMDKAVIRKNSFRTEHLCNQLLSKPGTKLRLEAIQHVTILHRAEKVAARVFAERRLAKRELGLAPRKLEWLSKPKAAAKDSFSPQKFDTFWRTNERTKRTWLQKNPNEQEETAGPFVQIPRVLTIVTIVPFRKLAGYSF